MKKADHVVLLTALSTARAHVLPMHDQYLNKYSLLCKAKVWLFQHAVRPMTTTLSQYERDAALAYIKIALSEFCCLLLRIKDNLLHGGDARFVNINISTDRPGNIAYGS